MPSAAVLCFVGVVVASRIGPSSARELPSRASANQWGVKVGFEKAHEARAYAHNERGASRARGPRGKDNPQWQAERNRGGENFSRHAHGALFRTKTKVDRKPPPSWFVPQAEPQGLRPTAESEPLFTFQCEVADVRTRSGPLRLRNPIYLGLFLASLGIVLTPASAEDAHERSRRSERSKRRAGGAEPRADTDIGTFHVESADNRHRLGVNRMPEHPSVGNRKIRSANVEKGPSYNTVHQTGNHKKHHHAHGLRALTPAQKSMLQVIRESAPDRMKEIGRHLKERGIEPDKQYTIKITARNGFRFETKHVTERADTLVAENHALINLLQFRGEIPQEIKEIDINAINDLHKNDVEQYKRLVAEDTSNEIMDALHLLGFHRHDRVMVHSISIQRPSKIGDVDETVGGAKARALHVVARDQSHHWLLLAPDRKAGALKDFKRLYRDLMKWVERYMSTVFETDDVRTFVDHTVGTPRVVLWELGELNLEDAVKKNVEEIVVHAVDRGHDAKYHETPGERMAADFVETLEEELIPGYQQYQEANNYGLDAAFGDGEIQIITGVIPGIGAAGREAEQVALRGAEDALKRQAKQEAWELAEQIAKTEEQAVNQEGNLINQGRQRLEGAQVGGAVAQTGRGPIKRYMGRALECILDLSARRGRRGVECVGYWHPSFADATEVSQSVKQEIEKIKTLIASDRTLVANIKSPAGACEASLQPTMTLAREAGHQPKALGAFLSYGIGGESTNNHFAVVIEIEGTEYVIDTTAHQFPALGFAGPFVGPREYFERTIVSSAKKPVLISKEFERAGDAVREFHTTELTNFNPLKSRPGTQVKTEADWYLRAQGNARAVAELEARQEAARRAEQLRQRQIRQRAFQDYKSQNGGNNARGAGGSNGRLARLKNRFAKYVVGNG